MTTHRIAFIALFGCGLPSAALAQSSPVSANASDLSVYQRMLDAEDARARDSSALAPIFTGLRSPDIATRRTAARALGRIERLENLPALEPMVTDSSPLVRAEAINAIGQVAKAAGANPAAMDDDQRRALISIQGLLRGLTTSEADPVVRGTLARTLGRLPYPSEDVARAASETIASLLDGVPNDGALAREPWFGIAHGTDALLRRFPNLRSATGVVRVAQISRVPSVANAARTSDTSWSRETNVILAAIRGRVLGAPIDAPNRVDSAAAREIRSRFLSDFGDADAQVRRQVVASAAVAAALDDSARARVVNVALRDRSANVRVEAVRAYGRRRGAACAPLIGATRDANAHVALTAIDALAASCEPAVAAIARLATLVRELPRDATARTDTRGSWHYGAHAAVSLARLAPDSARAAMPRLLAHPTWQVRMYAARAAGDLADTASLRALAQDPSDNVRSAAVVALSGLIRPAQPNATTTAIDRTPGVDSIFVTELKRRDYQLVLEAAKALDGAPASAPLGDALFSTLDRITLERRETSRDPRMELLARIETVGAPNRESRLRPYLTDYDPAIAERAAQILRKWGVGNAVAAARPMPPIAVPLGELSSLREARVRVTMAPASGGGSFELRLFVDEAPATIRTFIALALKGYYDGLTFHRVATNFVIQGGSPGANEYAGNNRYLRDELGLRSHERATLGISTRGRDTGDAQIFVNLIDNWRLDHDYTVFAEVVRGMEVVDAVLEGDVIARIDVLGAPGWVRK
jgi:cyclophilin family peptidyl-prolyl cis-trans isomerase/HEAT repeat protein